MIFKNRIPYYNLHTINPYKYCITWWNCLTELQWYSDSRLPYNRRKDDIFIHTHSQKSHPHRIISQSFLLHSHRDGWFLERQCLSQCIFCSKGRKLFLPRRLQIIVPLFSQYLVSSDHQVPWLHHLTCYVVSRPHSKSHDIRWSTVVLKQGCVAFENQSCHNMGIFELNGLNISHHFITQKNCYILWRTWLHKIKTWHK